MSGIPSDVQPDVPSRVDHRIELIAAAVILFFVGMGGKFSSIQARRALMIFAGVVLALGVTVLATFPIQS